MDNSKVRAPEAAVKPQGFVMLPATLLADRRVTRACLDVLAAILSHWRPGRPCFPGVERLALRSGRCRRTVQLALRRLEATGWLVTRPSDNRTGREFALPWYETLRAQAGRRKDGEQRPAALAPELKSSGEKQTPASPTSPAKAGSPPPGGEGVGSPDARPGPEEIRSFFAAIRFSRPIEPLSTRRPRSARPIPLPSSRPPG